MQQARTLARRRLIGATLLVLMAIVGFPMLFESQPRPIPVDIPIDIPRSEGAPALAIPSARSQVIEVEPAVAAASAAEPSRHEASEPARAEEPAAPRRESPPAAEQDDHRAGNNGNRGADKPAARIPEPPSRPTAVSEARPAARPSPAEAARARALLEGRGEANNGKPAASAPAAAPGRFVVQVGAFADASAAKDVRQKVEKLGLKTYTQVVETSSGSRTRVRVGPLESREQAEKVQDRLKAAGVSAVVLTL